MIFTYTYIINSPMLITDIPRINITYDSKPDTENYEICTFELISENSEENIGRMESKIKQQGSPASWKKKKSYRLELSQPKSLLGMRLSLIHI